MIDHAVILCETEPFETWHMLANYRWAVLEGTTTEPPVLQVLWQSDAGRQEWRRVETVVVSREEYTRAA